MIEFYAFINEASTFGCLVNVIQIYISSKLAQIIQRGKLFKSIQYKACIQQSNPSIHNLRFVSVTSFKKDK